MLGLDTAIAASMAQFADTSGAINTVREWVLPAVQNIASLATVVAVLLIVYAGYMYITSRGNPERMENAKGLLKKTAIGLVIVLAAVVLTSILSQAYGTPQNPANATMPNLQAIEPKDDSNGLLDMIIKAITGVLVKIINGAATPFLNALDFFTKSTPAMASNQSVFNFWLAMVGIADVLFILVVALIGFHVMSASALGFDEIDIRHLWPRLLLIFALMNSSIFLIDGIIGVSNVLITAVGQISGTTSVWSTLTGVVEKTSGLGLAALFIMLAFVLFSIVLLVYYVMRLVTLYLGAVLSPLVALLWLVPGFRDFAETAFKTYITTIFVLFVHVVILQLSASLFAGMATASGDNAVPDTLMAMVTGIATIFMLLKAQGTMMQFSYVSMGARNMKKLGGQFINGVTHMTGKGQKLTKTISSKTDSARKTRMMSNAESKAVRTGKVQSVNFSNKKGTAAISHTVVPKNAPTVKATRVPSTSSKDKAA
jgi:hypothetical protein